MVGTGGDTEINMTNGEFTFVGTITLQTEGDDIRIDDAYLCVYDNDISLVGKASISPLYPGVEGASEVDMRLSEDVKYIIVDHPKLRQFRQSTRVALVYDSSTGEYVDFAARGVSLEYDVSEMKGGCAEVSEA